LERAIRPADEARRHRTKECVHDEVVEKAEADREQNEIGKQRFNDNGRRQRLRRARECNRRGDDPDHQEREREVAQDKPDYIAHR
jgi:hypothetical protein